MFDGLNQIFSTSAYTSMVDKDRARLVYGVTVVLLLLYSGFALLVPSFVGNLTMLQSALTGSGWLLNMIVVYTVGITTLVLTRVGGLSIAEYGPSIIVYVGTVMIGLNAGFIFADDTLPLMIFIVLGGLMIGETGVLISLVVALVTLAVGYAGRPDEVIRGAGLASVFNVGLELTFASALIYLYLRVSRTSEREQIVQINADRLKLAEITAKITQRISNRLSLGQVLTDAVEQVRQQYPSIYHAQIFLIDERREFARLSASTGKAGRLMLQRGHRLEIGSQSVIGQVTFTGKPIIAVAGSQDSVHKRNEFLPDTVVEAAFPLRVGENIIGALDLQSDQQDGIKQGEAPLFQSLADSIAIAIDNARLFEEAEARIQENQQLLEQARESAREVERLNRQLIGQAWEHYLTGKRGTLNLNMDYDGTDVHPNDEWTNSLARALRANEIIERVEYDVRLVSVPLRIRGQVIGAMEFELDDAEPLSAEDLDLIEKVGERFGLAVENSRLFEESQRLAQREALVNAISTRLQASNNVETVLTEAARSLEETLGAGRIAIRLGGPDLSPAAQTNGADRADQGNGQTDGQQNQPEDS